MLKFLEVLTKCHDKAAPELSIALTIILGNVARWPPLLGC